MNVAICDDDMQAAILMEMLVDEAFGHDSNTYNCKVFLSGDDLMQYLDQHLPEFQIYLLDIEMAGIDGLQIASRIREKDMDAIIIFVTSHAELMPQAFRVLAFQYLVKPVDKKAATAVLLSAIDWIERRRSTFHYSVHKQQHTLNLSQIEYMESIGRKITIHTIDGDKQVYYGTLKEAAEKTKGLLFARPHTSYIVNLEHLMQLKSHSIRMKSGDEIIISSKYHASFHAAYRNFILYRTRSGGSAETGKK